MVSGVYLIVNKKTGQKYAGGSIHIERRIREHINKPNNASYIDKAIQKHGFDSFDWQVIEELPADWEIIGEREKYWINFYNTFKNPEHYNLTSGGERDFKMSEGSRKKISENHADFSGKNNPMYGSNRSGKNGGMSGKKHTEESIKQMSYTRSQKQNKTGFYRVSKLKCNNCRKGFYFAYIYMENGKDKRFYSVSLEKLEKKVKNADLPWKILDEEKALKTLNEVSF